MAVPRNRLSNARKNSRRAHHAKQPVQLVACTNCHTPIRPHRACPQCEYYGGKSVARAESH